MRQSVRPAAVPYLQTSVIEKKLLRISNGARYSVGRLTATVDIAAPADAATGSEGDPVNSARRRFLQGAGAAVAAPALSRVAWSQVYPARTVRIIVSSLPGGSPDIGARVLADHLSSRWGQPVVVENRPGAGGNLGAAEVAAAEGDGYTLLAAQPAPLTTNVLLYRKLGFDPAALVPIIVMTTLPNVLVVRRDFPASDMTGLIAYVRANPGKVTYGSQGIGTTTHLTAELFARRVGASLIHVPYRGSGQAVNDVIAGHIDMLFMQIDAVRENYTAGRLKMLAVASAERIPSVKDVPTMAEVGIANFLSSTWSAIAAPPRTGAPIVAKINTAMNELLHTPDISQQFERLGMQPVGGSPAEMAALVHDETRRWGEVIKAANIKL
jgi:tripartite-type tricarboxylate transporter receptor subunit TctC